MQSRYSFVASLQMISIRILEAIVYYIAERQPRENRENGANWRENCEKLCDIWWNETDFRVSTEQTRK